jgi:hypothetical protein
MHIDGWCSHAWMVQLTGRKRWTIFSQKDVHRLGLNRFSTNFAVNSSAFVTSESGICIQERMIRTNPLAARLMPLQAQLNAGDFLFIPSRSPHFVENLNGKDGGELVLGISGNFLDQSNLECALAALKAGCDAKMNPDVFKLHEALTKPGFDALHHAADRDGNPWDGEQTVSWGAFKSGNHLLF